MTQLALESVRPGEAGYEAAARVFFATGTPALIVRPRDPGEVADALALAGDRPLSVRSGGHSAVGHGTNDGGVVIDLGRLDQVDVLDRDRRLVRVGSGATWGRVAAELDPYGWALTAGDTTDVGVGGLTLGGGMGWLVRRYGLAIDNLVAARVVIADGRLITASATEHADLFWALRGGGGNFGVVVDFDFVAQPVPTVHFGTVAYEPEDVGEVLTRWRDAMRAAPDELTSTLLLTPAGPTILLCFAGEPDTAEAEVDAAIEPLLTLGRVTRATIAERAYGQILEHAEPPPGLRMAIRNVLVPSLTSGVLAAVARLHATPGPRMLALRSLGGAFGRVPADGTAFAHRDAEAMIVCAAMLPEGVDEAAVFAPWGDVAAHGTGTYLNFQGSATAADLAAAYPPATLARLAAVKRMYDPRNRFQLNHNVRPA
jgi:FAD/FMN-containing dehydrogenase